MSRCSHCTNLAKLQCPECLKRGIPYHFCSQECFKSAWPTHKLVHTYNPWPNMEFTGSLRPFPLTPRRLVPDHISKPDYAVTGIPESENEARGKFQIKALDEDEQETMRMVCRMARQVLNKAAAIIQPGVTTDEIDRVVHESCIELDAYPSPLNYQRFPKSCCTSVNEVICHGIPDMRPLVNGDLVNIDVSLYHSGFHADLNETYAVGDALDQRGKDLINCARDCMNEAIKIVKPGTKYRDIGDVIQKVATSRNFTVNRTYCGHGVHRLFHCDPIVPHYAKNKAAGIMAVGHVFTIEPMICEGKASEVHWRDNWTAVTMDGKRSAQFEQTLLVTPDGVEILTE